ncbi:hypothetical protein [Streptomyces sp. ICBB 8177]|uniref:hypothetical protein n=1 Tax=Streptomyces sp. ICBB 8177 TaxID=563922 RepID=UPI0018EEBAFD|nr:hypothetical protein [Streptomyces sp. ICBB 8177]
MTADDSGADPHARGTGGGQRMGPERNRVTPTGEIVATALRGAWTGNRGVLHEGHEIVRFHASDLWITCVLEFRGRWREQWLPHRYTHLYFHDEAVSFAAGHRPCGECRHRDYQAYRQAWSDGVGDASPSARQMNRRLHGERIVRGTHRRRYHEMPWAGLPDGTFVLIDTEPALVVDGHLTRWSPSGYAGHGALPRAGTATVITPPASVAVLRAGYPVQIDDSAR